MNWPQIFILVLALIIKNYLPTDVQKIIYTMLASNLVPKVSPWSERETGRRETLETRLSSQVQFLLKLKVMTVQGNNQNAAFHWRQLTKLVRCHTGSVRDGWVILRSNCNQTRYRNCLMKRCPKRKMLKNISDTLRLRDRELELLLMVTFNKKKTTKT